MQAEGAGDVEDDPPACPEGGSASRAPSWKTPKTSQVWRAGARRPLPNPLYSTLVARMICLGSAERQQKRRRLYEERRHRDLRWLGHHQRAAAADSEPADSADRGKGRARRRFRVIAIPPSILGECSAGGAAGSAPVSPLDAAVGTADGAGGGAADAMGQRGELGPGEDNDMLPDAGPLARNLDDEHDAAPCQLTPPLWVRSPALREEPRLGSSLSSLTTSPRSVIALS